MSQIKTIHTFYVKDVKSGNILSINVRGGKEEIEKQNRDLTKKGQKHLIKFVPLTKEEEDDYLKSINPEKKAGRPYKKEN